MIRESSLPERPQRTLPLKRQRETLEWDPNDQWLLQALIRTVEQRIAHTLDAEKYKRRFVDTPNL
jgi:hypothetical protein